MMSVSKITLRLIGLAASTLAAISCINGPSAGEIVRVEFTAESEVLELTPGSDVAVFGADKYLELRKEKNGVSFKGKVIAADEYYAVYPAGALKYFSPSEPVTAVMNIPVVQTGRKGVIPRQYSSAVAHASDADRHFIFREAVSYLKFTIPESSVMIRSVSVMAEGSRLSGDIAADCTSDDPAASAMPNSASNVCLIPEGEYFEPGEYYLAVIPGDYFPGEDYGGYLNLALEDDRGCVALKDAYLSQPVERGEIVDLGTISDIVFQPGDIISSSSTYVMMPAAGGVEYLYFFSTGDFEVSVDGGCDWITVVRTRVVDTHMCQIEVAPNQGRRRSGNVIMTASDGSSRLVYTIVQNPAPESVNAVQRAALEELYRQTGGQQWAINQNWCTDLPLSDWYGVQTNPDGTIYSVYLSGNNLSGNLTEQAVSGLSDVSILQINNNMLSGTIPAAVFDIPQVFMYANGFDSIAEVSDPEKRIIRSLSVSGNNLSGTLPAALGRIPSLTNLDLSSNQFTGQIPDSYAGIENLNLNHNRLSGKIPQSMADLAEFRRNGWINVLYQEGEGFDLSGLSLQALGSTVYTTENEQISLSDVYASNEYTLLFDVTGGTYYIYQVDEWFKAYRDKGFGVVGYNQSYYVNDIKSEYDLEWIYLASVPYRLPVTPNFMLVDSKGKMIINPVDGKPEDVLAFLERKYGKLEDNLQEPAPEIPEVPEVIALQTASDGDGIDIVLMGDKYAADQDDIFASDVEVAVDALFSIEPFASYRELFNVYMVNGASVGSYMVGDAVKGDDAKCFDYAMKAVTEERLDDAVIVVIVNDDTYGGTTSMGTALDGDYGRGRAISYVNRVSRDDKFKYLIRHEAIGHAFAKLADEYGYEENGSIPSSVKNDMQSKQAYGWWGNCSFTSDPSSVRWARFITDFRYASEKIGVYEGAASYDKGIWRPSERSIMRDESANFNAPSREIIWYRIHKLAYGGQWQYDFEDFVQYDAVNRP